MRRCSRRTWGAFAGTRVPDSHFPSAGSGGTNSLGRLKSSGSGVSVGVGAVAGGVLSACASSAFCCIRTRRALPRRLVTSPAVAKAVAVAAYALRRAALVALDVPMSPSVAICNRLQADASSSVTMRQQQDQSQETNYPPKHAIHLLSKPWAPMTWRAPIRMLTAAAARFSAP